MDMQENCHLHMLKLATFKFVNKNILSFPIIYKY